MGNEYAVYKNGQIDLTPLLVPEEDREAPPAQRSWSTHLLCALGELGKVQVRRLMQTPRAITNNGNNDKLFI